MQNKIKKVLTFIGVILFASTISTSCGGGGDKATLTVDKVNITGDSKDYIEVVPGTYYVKKTKGTLGEELQLTLKFRVTNSYDPNKIDENTGIGNLNLQFTDGSGSPIDYNFGPAGASDWDKINSLLKGKPGDEVTVLFKPSGFSNDESNADVLKNGKGIEITKADVTNPKTEPLIDNSISSTAGGDCDQFIKDYEEFANSYIKLIKKYKANPNDQSILSEYTEAAQKAIDMQENAGNCTDTKYASKLLEIANRMAKAAL